MWFMRNDAGKPSSIKTYNRSDVIYVGDENSLPISNTDDIYVNTHEG